MTYISALGTATVTTNQVSFKQAINALSVTGGGDCPELAFSGIEVAATHSLPNSFIYVLTDASAKDAATKYTTALNLVKSKQCKVSILVAQKILINL